MGSESANIMYNRCPMYNLIIIGGGAAGFFAAITAKKFYPNAKIIILEKSKELLSKVKLSGGGRCNVTHACFDLKQLIKNYPRGNKELLGPFHKFQPKDMLTWLEEHNVKCQTEIDGRIFPTSNKSETIINALTQAANCEILFNQNISVIEPLKNHFEIVANDKTFKGETLLIATGSSLDGYNFAKKFGHTILTPIPSLFAFNCPNSPLKDLTGIALDNIGVSIENTNFKVAGPLLITHFGFSGQAILNLSSLGARFLYEKNYQAVLNINWLTNFSFEKILSILMTLKAKAPSKHLYLENAFNLPKNLWKKLLSLSCIDFEKPLGHFSNQQFNDIAQKLHNDSYNINGKNIKDEFVTCGGIVLKEIDFRTMQSKLCERLFFAGEILDIDGLCGGFNLQNAWTTGFIAGSSATHHFLS